MRYENLYLTSKEYAEHVAYWTKQSDLLGKDYQYSFKQTWNSYPDEPEPKKKQVLLSDESRKKLEELSNKELAGYFVLVLTGLYILLHKYGNRDLIQVNTPLFDFDDKEDTSFGNDIPLVVNVPGDMTIKELIGQVQQTVTDSYRLQNFPISRVSEKFHSDVIVYCPGLHQVRQHTGKGLFVTIVCGNRLEISLSGIKGFSSRFFAVLASSLDAIFSNFSNLDKRIREIDWTKNNSYMRRTIETVGAAETGSSDTIPALFEAQAKQTPGKVAITGRKKTLSYQELNTASDRLAVYLQKECKIVKGDAVAVMMERSEWLVISMLAIMKAGAVYLPINPEDPGERVSFILKDASAKLLLVKPDQFSKQELPALAPVLKVDDLLLSLPADKDQNIQCDMTGSDAAYIIYTSGSTGKPKGVIVEHSAFTYMITTHIGVFNISCDERIPFFFPPSFDASLKHVFLSLFTGSTLLIPGKETLDDPVVFLDFLEKEQATVANISPAYLKLLDLKRLSRIVRMVITGGETPHVGDAVSLANTITYFNSYGPTEASVCCTYHKVIAGRNYGKCIPMGEPIAGTEILILDKYHNEVPVGAIGEIGIAGKSLARGYVNNDELTREKFIVLPGSNGKRVYMTGDLGIMLPDGTIEYAGRQDNQVKIRGYRIELDEIRQNLLSCSLVDQAIVIKRDDVIEDTCLVAYITGKEKLDTELILSYLKERIPSYMLPYFIIQLEELPLTVNGKIDEPSLPHPHEFMSGAKTYMAPRNEIEISMAGIWSGVLAKTDFGINENFFDLGGTSFQVIKMFEQMNNLFPDCVKISELFDHPTIEMQSGLIAERSGAFAQKESDYKVTSF